MEYNPHSPQNLGMEWVPIRQANYVPDNVNERGYIMHIDSSAVVVSGHVGINDLAPQLVTNTATCVNVYPEATALDSGPVRSVTIPVDAISITGGQIIATNGFASLNNPNDFDYVSFSSTAVANTDQIGISFDTTTYVNELSGKRILKVRLKYAASAGLDIRALGLVQTKIARQASSAESFNYQTGLEGAIGANVGPGALALNTDYHYVDFGDWNPVWTPGVSANGLATSGSMAILPWRYTELALLDGSAAIASKQVVLLTTDAVANWGDVTIGYMALEVFYCEETRVAYGGRRSAVNGFPINSPFIGDNFVQIKDTSFAIGKTLTPGNYLVTATHRAISNYVSAKAPPTFAGIRQPNNDWPVIGKFITVPATTIDAVLGEEDTQVITDIGLYTASSVVTGSHTYANQIDAPVYGSITAIQDIHSPSSSGLSSTPFTQVKFYARRFASTSVPLRIELTGSATVLAEITVDEFDVLPEIIDGWREILLRLDAPVTVTAGTSFSMTWSAVGENAGSQWQVLGAQHYDNATFPSPRAAGYNPPFGSTFELTWKSPNVTVSTLDSNADATIMLAQDLPAPTNFTVTALSQAVTGIAVECGVPNDCIPTGIGYLHVGWDSIGTCDDFEREVASGLGVAPSGEAWTANSITGTVSVADSHAIISHGAVANGFIAHIEVGDNDQVVYAEFEPTVLAVGGSLLGRLYSRFTDTNNAYAIQIAHTTAGLISVTVSAIVGGSFTTIMSPGTVGQYGANSRIAAELRVTGTLISARVWNLDDDEPDFWQGSVVDATVTSTGTRAGFFTRLETGNTNTLPVEWFVDNFSAVPANYAGGTIEVQRQDDEDDDDTWQTIMDTSTICVTGAADYEARVGMESRYRARAVDALGFPGLWVTGAGTLPTPGVDGVSDGNSMLIFTSNQQPESNLAYPMVWEGRPIEAFVFPEVDTQTFQRLYGRDFQVAFRPLERGGEQFERVLLVQAAAIPVASLANFRSLRDLAWADLLYVCVRDELGNRWYANVLVPSGQVQRNRRLYLAQIRVTEVTDTPAPITS